MRVAYTVDVDDDLRRAIRMHYGLDGLASWAEVHSWYELHGSAGDDDLAYSLQEADDDA